MKTLNRKILDKVVIGTVAFVSFIFIGCYDWFQESTTVPVSANNYSISQAFAKKVQEVDHDLTPTSQIIVSQGKYSDRIEVTWSAVLNADCYKVDWVRVAKSTLDTEGVKEVDKVREAFDSQWSEGETNGEFKKGTDYDSADYIYSTSYVHKLFEDPKYVEGNAFDYKYFYRVTAKNSMNPTLYSSEKSTTHDYITEFYTDENGITMRYKTEYTKYKVDESTDEYILNEAGEKQYNYQLDADGNIQYEPDKDGNPDTNRPLCTETLIHRTIGNSGGYLLPVVLGTNASKADPKGDKYSTIDVSWNPVEEASYYKLYRTDDENGFGLELIESSIRGTEYTNIIPEKDSGKTFYYVVYAVTSAGDVSVKGPMGSGYTAQEGAPIAPTNVRVTNGRAQSTNGLKVEWDPTGEGDEYVVYRSKSTDNFAGTERVGKQSPKNEYEDPSPMEGIIYCYQVQTIKKSDKNDEELKSRLSDSGMKTEKGEDNPNRAIGFLLSVPKNLEVNDAPNGEVDLRWSPASGYDYLEEGKEFEYQIKSASEQNGSFNPVTTAKGKAGDDGFIHATVEKANFFVVATLNEGISSADSGVVAPSPNAPQEVKATKTEKLKDKWEANGNGVYPVMVTWKASPDEAAGYVVTRSEKPDGSYKKLFTEPIAKEDPAYYDSATKTYSYIDVNGTAKVETYYYYKVQSKNSLKQGSKSNEVKTPKTDPACGYGALTPTQWFKEYDKTITSSHKKLTLINKKQDTQKLGDDKVKGNSKVNGELGLCHYNAALAGLGAHIEIEYKNYCDAYIQGNEALGPYFIYNGHTDSDCNMSSNGWMSGDIVVTGMYPGVLNNDKLEVKGGDAGAGYYPIKTYNLNFTGTISGKYFDKAQVEANAANLVCEDPKVPWNANK